MVLFSEIMPSHFGNDIFLLETHMTVRHNYFFILNLFLFQQEQQVYFAAGLTGSFFSSFVNNF